MNQPLRIRRHGKMDKKGFLQISFAWLFAIIVGAIILSLTIFAVTKMIGTQETVSVAKTAKEIGVLLNPLETGFEIGKTTTIGFPTETRIYNRCDDVTEAFGKQGIQVSQKSFEKWTETDLEVSFYNKYIFSEDYEEGKIFYLFSKPFEAPFKVSDLIYLTSSEKTYCFVSPPTDIYDELTALNQKNIAINNCTDEDNEIEVCFIGDCDIKVDYGGKYMKKGEETLHFREDALMYAAIFSDSDIYNCQLKRLMKRVSQLSQIYTEKEQFISYRDCRSNLMSELSQLENMANNLENSANLGGIWNIVKEIEEKNELNSDCKLF